MTTLDPGMIPPPPAASRWMAGLRELALPTAQARMRLPPFHNLPAAVLVRALYRSWLERQPRFAPLVHVAREHLGPLGYDPLWQELPDQAADGWLFIDGSLDPAEAAALQAGPACLVDLDPERPGRIAPADLRRQLLLLDAWHGALVDPTLAAQRSTLARLPAPSLLTLRGPAGAGRDGLVMAASFLATGALPSPAQPNGWLVIRAAEELAHRPAELSALKRQLRLAEEAEATPFPPVGDPGPRPQDPAFAAIIGESRALRLALHAAARAAPGAEPVLLLGPTGAGKGAFAAAIHRASGRRGPFVAVDLSSRAESLLESELFGHVRGAFTEARTDHPGWFEQADGGTLFLDEIGNLPLALQARLLRPLQERRVTRLGALREVAVDVRIIAATNANLAEMCEQGSFRLDLFHRLAGALLPLPALRERPDDVLPIAAHHLGLPPEAPWCEPAARAILEDWHWPGNVRELQSVITQAWRRSQGRPLRPADLHLVDERRTVVLIGADPEAPIPLSPEERRRCSRQQLTLPALAARGPQAARSAILASLQGLPIRSAALAAAAATPWPSLDALQAQIQGWRAAGRTVELTDLHPAAPPAAQTEAAPLWFLLHPTRQDEALRGLTSALPQAVVLLGRARHIDELAALGRSRRPADLTLHQEIEGLLEGAPAGLLSLPGHPELSRFQLLFRRRGGALEVIRPSRPGLVRVRAGGLSDPEALDLRPGDRRLLGPVAEILLDLGEESRPIAHLFAAIHAAAAAAATPALLDRLPAEVAPGPITAGLVERGRVWALNAEEQEAIAQIFAQIATEGGPQKRVIERWRAAAARPTLTALLEYLSPVHPTQSVSRLVEHRPNAALRRRLQDWLAAHPARALAEERLGRMLTEAVGAPHSA